MRAIGIISTLDFFAIERKSTQNMSSQLQIDADLCTRENATCCDLEDREHLCIVNNSVRDEKMCFAAALASPVV